jgi:uncharacterized protein
MHTRLECRLLQTSSLARAPHCVVILGVAHHHHSVCHNAIGRSSRSLQTIFWFVGMNNFMMPFVGYLSLFYLAWTFVWVYSVYPWATLTVGAATFAYALINIAFRLLIWVLPVVGYLRYIDNVPVLEYLKLKQYWRRGVIVGLTLSAINFFGTMTRVGPPVWSGAHVTWNSVLGTSILIGVFEEIPFRGFILQKLCERFDFVTSMVISSILFVGVHVPGWIMLGTLTAYNIIYVLGFGAAMAIVLRYSQSLWAPIITHSLNDCLSNVIFHI